jgi:hypothetical protein
VRQCRLLARPVPVNETRDRHKRELPDHDARLPVHIWIAVSEEFAMWNAVILSRLRGNRHCAMTRWEIIESAPSQAVATSPAVMASVEALDQLSRFLDITRLAIELDRIRVPREYLE